MPPTGAMADEEAPQLLSPELAASLGVAGGDAMLTSAKKKQKPGGGGGAKHGPRRGNALPVVKKLSKSQKRKLAKVEEDKRKREQRAGVVARLNAAKLVSDESLTLLQGSDRMGQKMSKRETLRRELKAERAGIALPGSEHSRLLKRERPRDEQDGGEDESSGSDASDASDAEDASDEETFGRKQSWPNKALTPSTAPPPKESYGPIHPLDQARLDAERIKKAEMDALAGNDEDDDEEDANANAAQKAASESARAASKEALAAARALAEHVRALDPEQAAERRIAALGPNAAAAAYDPKDAAAKMAAANEAAAAAAAARYPGVFVGASRRVAVTRDAEVVAAREGLPILGSEHEIVDAINSNPVVVLCGETGCGKTTQVPQFLFEAGYGDKTCLAHPGAVAVTQPRRVAVTSTATRVARELNVKLGKEVGYQVRYDKKVMREHGEDQTRLKFMTDGILLREMRTDLLLRKYSVVIVDEAHERGVNTDILLGLLSRVVPLRAELFKEGRAGITPLRLVVMSATLRVEEFVENKKLCPTPPALLKIKARQFPVTTHFARETVHGDYVSAARKKTLAIHRKLPPGGILVFVTGQREVEQLCAKLRRAHPPPDTAKRALREGDEDAEGAEGEKKEPEERDSAPLAGLDAFGADVADDAGEEDRGDEDLDIATDGDDFDDFDKSSDSDADSDVSEEEEVVVHGGEGVTPEAAAEAEAAWVRAHAPTTVAAASAGTKNDAEPEGPGYLHVLPLYAMLPPHLQKRVFDPPPPGARSVIVATNVAETSLTIPNTRYVVDCGREKRRVFGSASGAGDSEDAAAQSAGVSRFSVQWVSQASAEQRAGRAGRTGPGHCYRLFSSAHFVNELEPHAPPAICSVPVDGVVLQMRAMGIDKIERFPFLTPPEPGSLRRAQRTLAVLGALRPSGENAARKANRTLHGHFGSFGDDGDVGVLTPLGEQMAALPIGPRHARMLLAAAHSGVTGCLEAAVAAAAALSLDSPFLRDDKEKDEKGESSDALADKEALARRKKQRHRFHHPHSDALSAARALVAYDAVRDPRDADLFCRDHCLHGRTMREASDLRRQLLRALASPSAARAFSKDANEAVARAAAFLRANASARKKMFPPRGDDPALVALRVAGEAFGEKNGSEAATRRKQTRKDEKESRSRRDETNDFDAAESSGDAALRRALLRGWADRVARRVKPSEESDSADLPKTRATRYKPALLSSTVYLHPSSSLHKTSPEYVVYADVAATEKRSYLGGATAVDASWLCDDAAALTSLSAPLEDPMPRYVPSKGIVVCFSQPHFWKHRWALPLRAESMRADEGGCGAFAAAVLSGAVSPPMQTLRERMAAKPSLCARAEGKTQRRVGELVHALQRRGVASKEELKAQWRRDPAYLMREATLWMKRGHEHFLERAWPRVVANALGEENAERDSSSARQMTDQGARSGGGVAGVAVAGGSDEHAERAGERARLAEGAFGAPSGRADRGAVATARRPSSKKTGTASNATERRGANAKAKRRRANPAALDAGLSIWD